MREKICPSKQKLRISLFPNQLSTTIHSTVGSHFEKNSLKRIPVLKKPDSSSIKELGISNSILIRDESFKSVNEKKNESCSQQVDIGKVISILEKISKTQKDLLEEKLISLSCLHSHTYPSNSSIYSKEHVENLSGNVENNGISEKFKISSLDDENIGSPELKRRTINLNGFLSSHMTSNSVKKRHFKQDLIEDDENSDQWSFCSVDSVELFSIGKY
ncbi:hypothetical protein WICMUC_003643 [Wickerhamomyces mucosus]|uniref:Uncharacterized protein n=1 Tax=Wickerhamomyces mucosus TaxID=1378264 RepID=A0A9P8TCS2_9ASCO|nr:hypothetical protein WICMUC_003643 [Wickerhamomyces mucosus]